MDKETIKVNIEATKEAIKRDVTAIIVDKLNVPAEEVTPTAHFTNDLGADSLDQVELVMELEKKFNVFIKDEQAAALQTVGDVTSYLEQNLPSDHPLISPKEE